MSDANDKPTWSDVRASVKKLQSTLDAVEKQLKGRSTDPVEDLFSQMFAGKGFNQTG